MNIMETIINAIRRFFGFEEKTIIPLDGNLHLVDEGEEVIVEEPVPPKGRDIKEGVQPPKPTKKSKKKVSKKKASKKKASKKKYSKKKKEK